MGKQDEPLPIIEQCEGADADDRASVASAWLRLWRQQSKRQVTDLHCEQFILAVFAVDKKGSGVQWSYEEIADRLRVSVSTARAVVRRCVREFGIVAAIEERYAKGGQAANRYTIEFQVVRSVNAGLLSRSEVVKANDRLQSKAGSGPGVVTEHPGVVTEHPGVVTRQPYKECPSISPSIQTSILRSERPKRSSDHESNLGAGNGECDSAHGAGLSRPQSDLRTERPVQGVAVREETHVIQSTECEHRAGWIWEGIGYRGDQGFTFWLAAAALELGLIAEEPVAKAVALTRNAKSGPGYFRTVLAEKAGLGKEGLTQLLNQIRVLPNLPGSAPSRAVVSGPKAGQASLSNVFKRCPSAISARELERRSAKFQSDLRVLDSQVKPKQETGLA